MLSLLSNAYLTDVLTIKPEPKEQLQRQLVIKRIFPDRFVGISTPLFLSHSSTYLVGTG
jgi:hypothetical protein